jgi:uncharacterized short protein YbdD (DUF466 family)
MRDAWDQIWRGMRRAWLGLREWSGDAAYEKYVRCVRRVDGGEPVTEAEFYVEELKRKYSRPSRCC